MTRAMQRRVRRVGRRLGIRKLARMGTGEPLKGLAVGIASGLVAAWMMERFQGALSRISQSISRRRGESDGHEQSQPHGEEQEPATVATAVAISRKVLHRDLTRRQKAIAGPLVHYGYGATLGGIYGMLAERTPAVTAGGGTAFGTAAWMLGDNAMLWALGLAKAPTQYPLSTHAYALASHLVYGATVEGVRRALRGGG